VLNILKSRVFATAVLLLIALAILYGLFGEKLRSAFHSSKLGEEAYAHTEAILAIGPRPPASDGLENVLAYLTGQLARDGWTTQAQEFDRHTPQGRIHFTNLRARHGTATPATWDRPVDLVLACHIDSKIIPNIRFLGADDSASSAGAILVIARKLSRDHPDLAGRVEIVFFDGEESFDRNITRTDGLYGSRHYARVLRTWKQKPRHGIVLDMIGHRNLSIRIPSDTPKPLHRALMEAARSVGTAHYFDISPGAIDDDHVPLNNAGVPTIDIVGDFPSKSWWHTSRDNIHNISPESLDASIRTTLALVENLLAESGPPR
jgi:glutaminyl-peptide cyclotransferase